MSEGVEIVSVIGDHRPDAIVLTSDNVLFQPPDAVARAERYVALMKAPEHTGERYNPLEGALMYEIGVEGDRFNPHRYTAACREAGCVPVGDIDQRSHISDHDAEHVFAIIGDPKADWFGALLLKLIAHADLANQETLALLYPDYVAAYRKALAGS